MTSINRCENKKLSPITVKNTWSTGQTPLKGLGTVLKALNNTS